MVFFQVAPVELLFHYSGCKFAWLALFSSARTINFKGLGETAIALAAGFAIPAVGYLSVRGQLDLLFAFFSFPFMLCGLILSLSLEAPDIEVDQKTGKRNFAVRKGERAVSGTILASSIDGYVVVPCLYMAIRQHADEPRDCSCFFSYTFSSCACTICVVKPEKA
jgi:1,4-dihydroxy-2-naphthoate octaprenyltransferase